MTPEQIVLARQLAALPGFRWDDGMLTHTTRAAGLPGCVAETPIRTQGGIGDLVVEGYFGPIEPDVSVHHPDFGVLSERREASIDAAQACALPDLTDNATGGVLLGWLEAMRVLLSVSPLAGIVPGGFAVTTFSGQLSYQARHQGDTLAEACARALIALGRCA